MKTKDEVFDRFRECKALVENVTGKKIKVLRSDNGVEYIDKDFTYFCVKEGIKREWTTPYNPQPNGVAEQKNRTIFRAAKAMLDDQDLRRFRWAEACNMKLYILNRTSHRALGKKTLEGVFIGKKPEVTHFRIFANVVYCYVLDEKRTKLDQTAEKCFLIGYSETSKAYRIYIPNKRKIVLRGDVKFMEDRAFKRSREMPAGDQSYLTWSSFGQRLRILRSGPCGFREVIFTVRCLGTLGSVKAPYFVTGIGC